MRIAIILGIMALTTSPVWAAKATIMGTTPDSKISGDLNLHEEKDGLTIEGTLTNVPKGKHAIHIHENGSCDDAGKAAGSHFNPDNAMHGYMPKDGMEHAHPGDMGNIEADEDGAASIKVFLPGVTLTNGKYAVTNKAIIVHEKEDDFSQPTGNAGGRIGCGLIQPNSVQPPPQIVKPYGN
jgi:superoxide dismutase, Cu-Zn family